MRLRYQRPVLYPKQHAAMFCDARFGLIEATTKAGKTISAIAWIIECCLLGQDGDNFWWVAPVHGQAVIAFNRIKNQLTRSIYRTHDSNKTITFRNGAILHFKSAEKPDNLYGDDVMALVVDEASRVREAAWVALRTTISATRAPARIIGNVKGRRNWFYRMCRRAEQAMAEGRTDMHYAKLTADDAVSAGVLAAEEIESARADLPEAVFLELYYAQASEDEGNPFGYDAIRACVGPLSTDEPDVWGWDLAKTMDWTVGIALDKHGRVCRIERFRGKVWGQITEKIVKFTGDAEAMVDATGVGDPVVDDLQKGRANFSGFKFTGPSKQQLMEGLALVINRQEITFPEGPIKDELEQFEYQMRPGGQGVRYSAPEGFFDDCVCALALAVKCMETFRGRGAWRKRALWTPEIWAACREPEVVLLSQREKKGEFSKIEVGITPPLKPGADIGIIVVGRRHDQTATVLDDMSVPGTEDMGKAALHALARWHADRIVVEPSWNGKLVPPAIRRLKKNVPIKFVRATMGTQIRAEPVAELYEKKLATHAGRFPELERQLSLFSKLGYQGERSPERASAAIWALSDLMLEPVHTYSLDNVR